MTFSSILFLSVGVAMDATAVSAARGMAVPAIRLRHVLLVAFFFGGFQALMPLIGWSLGARVGPLVQAWDHWIAFGLLCAIGGKMLYEALPKKEEAREADASREDAFGLKVMLVLAIATSIDALAVGISLPLIGAPLALSIATIGITTALLSALGLFAGRRFSGALGQRLDVVGGLVLIGIGAKILIEHTSG